MNINLSKSLNSGYTIIEVVISIFILILIFSVAQANYKQFTFNKTLDAVKSEMISDIKLAQEYALAGKTTTGCVGLNGYMFSTDVANNKYSIMANCATNIVIKEVSLAKLAKGVNISGSNTSILFKVLGGGTNIDAGGNIVFQIIQQTTNDTRSITVSSGGDVK